MNGMYLYEAMGHIRPAYVDEAEKQSFAKPAWRRMLPVAACLAVMVGLSLGALHLAELELPSLTQVWEAAAPGQTAQPELPDHARLGLAVLGVLVLGVVLLTTPKLRRFRSGVLKFLGTLGLQVLFVVICVVGRSSGVLFGDSFDALYPLLLLLVGQSVYIYILQKTPKERVSWGIPLGMAVFPLLLLLVSDWKTEEFLLSTYYVPCQMTTLMSTVILKFQNRKKGAA